MRERERERERGSIDCVLLIIGWAGDKLNFNWSIDLLLDQLACNTCKCMNAFKIKYNFY